MDINGNIGPKIKKIFSCEGCKWLGDIIMNPREYQKYSCLHPDVISKYSEVDFMYKVFSSTLNEDLSTPMFCPYILKKMRLEKLKKLDV